jgi:hypothetical protein
MKKLTFGCCSGGRIGDSANGDKNYVPAISTQGLEPSDKMSKKIKSLT